MACHEIAALRLGLMDLLGIRDEAERQHELAELGDALDAAGPLKSLVGAKDLDSAARLFGDAVTQLSERVARTSPTDPKIGYWRALLVLTRKVELDLRGQVDSLTRFHQELEEMHDFVHEIFPAS